MKNLRMQVRRGVFVVLVASLTSSASTIAFAQDLGGFINLLGDVIEQDMRNQQERRRIQQEERRYNQQQQLMRQAEQAKIDEERRREIALIKRMQSALSKLGFYGSKIDGDRGPGTLAAERLFATTFELPPLSLTEADVHQVESAAAVGFRTKEEVSRAAVGGFHDREELLAADDGGFATAFELSSARTAGFRTSREYQAFKASGFANGHEYRMASKGGFAERKEFEAARAAGFAERSEYLAFIKSKLADRAAFLAAQKARLAAEAAVRRQNIWHNSRRKLAECGPRPGVDIKRRSCGAASADVRWSSV